MTAAEPTLISSRCALCGDRRSHPVTRARDRMGVANGDFQVVACVSCGTWRLDPAPAPESIDGLYDRDYEAHNRPVRVPEPILPGRTHVWRRRFVEWASTGGRRIWTQPARKVPGLAAAWLFSRTDRGKYNLLAFPGDGRALLDVGCGSGELVAQFLSLGWSAVGIEPSADAVARARASGLRVEHGRFPEDAGRVEPYAPFGAVVMANVIEHLVDPRAALNRAATLLGPGGFLLLWAPVSDGWQQRLWPSQWYNLDAPRHLNILSRRGLGSLLNQCGFEVVAMRPASSARAVLRSVANRWRDNGRASLAARVERSSAARVLATPIVRMLDECGVGDVVTVLARKLGERGAE